jgi:hypothetical protein
VTKALFVLTAVLYAAIVCVGLSARQETTMAEPTYGVPFLVLTEDGATVDPPEATTPRSFQVYYDSLTNRIVIRGDDDGTKEIPTLTSDPSRPALQYAALMIDGDGDMATGVPGVDQPSLDFGAVPTSLKWPQGDQSTSVKGWTVRRDLSAAADTSPLELVAAETRLAVATGVDLNVGTKTTLFTVPIGTTAIITRVVLRSASASVTTAEFSFGYNAMADDVLGSRGYSDITASSQYAILEPGYGVPVGASEEVFGIKCSTLQGSALTVTVDVFGYLI